MAWDPVAKTSTGWSKGYDSGGNTLKYRRPNGNYASPSQYRGSLAHGEEFEVDRRPPKEPPDYDIPDYPEITEWDAEVIDSHHELAIDYKIDEGRIPIEDYPVENRIEDLTEKMQENSFDDVSWGLSYVIVEAERGAGVDPIIEHPGRRVTTYGPPDPLLHAANFREHIEELEKLADTYKDVLITHTLFIGRDYTEGFKP